MIAAWGDSPGLIREAIKQPRLKKVEMFWRLKSFLSVRINSNKVERRETEDADRECSQPEDETAGPDCTFPCFPLSLFCTQLKNCNSKPTNHISSQSMCSRMTDDLTNKKAISSPSLSVRRTKALLSASLHVRMAEEAREGVRRRRCLLKCQ